MNLRDLIYSQSQASQSFTQPTDPQSRNASHYSQTPQPLPQHVQQPAGDPKYDVAALFQREDGNEEDDIGPQPKRPRVAKAFATNRKLPIYGDSPLVLQQIDAERYGTKAHRFAPGLDGYIRFAQRDVPFAAFQRDVVRRLWFQCYYGKDFEGAAMALSVLTEIDPLTPTDITAAAQMLRYADRTDNNNHPNNNAHHSTNNANSAVPAGSESIKKLVQGLLKPHPRDVDKRHSAIAVSIELLLAQGDIKTARKVLTENITEFTSINRQELKAYDMLVIVANVVQLAQEIAKILHAPLVVPTIDIIAQDPLEFNKSVKIIHMARTATQFTNHKLKAKRQECNRIIQDLKASFVLSVYGSSAPVEHDRMELEALYIAYMYGVGHESKAIRYITNLKKSIQSAEVEASVKLDTLSRYYNLLSAYLARYRYVSNDSGGGDGIGVSAGIASSVFSSSTNNNSSVMSSQTGTGSATTNSTVGNASYSKIVKALVHQIDATPGSTLVPSLQDVYKLVMLYRIGGIERNVFIERLCEYIDNVPSPTHSMNTYKMKYGSALHYVLWRELATALGGIDSTNVVDANAPISPTSEIARYIPGLCGSTSSGDSTHATTTGANAVAQTVLNKHAWWRTSVLSSTQFDHFSAESAPAVDKAFPLLDTIVHNNTAAGGMARLNANPLNASAGVFDHYDVWKSNEVKFAADLTAAFAARHRSLSEDNDNSSNDESEDEKEKEAKKEEEIFTMGVGKGGKRRKKGNKDEAEEEEFVGNTSHDDTEYHSNESGEENGTQVPTGTATVGTSDGSSNGNGSTGSGVTSSVGYALHRDILAMAVVYRTNASTTKQDIMRAILKALGYTSPLGRKFDFSVFRQVVTNPLAAHAAPNSLLARNNHPVTQYVLGEAATELLTYQAMVSAHLYGQDSLFTLKAVQILVQQALRSLASADCHTDVASAASADAPNAMGHTAATECLMLLQRSNIHLHRALKIGNYLCKDPVDTMLPVAQHFTIAEDGIKLTGVNRTSYKPHVSGVNL